MKPVELLRLWKDVQSSFIKLLDSFSDKDLLFQPYPQAWSTSQIVLHVAEGLYMWSHFLAYESFPPDPKYTPASFHTRESVQKILEQDYGKMVGFISQLKDEDLDKVHALDGNKFTTLDALWMVLKHEIHHRGEISLILGILGKPGLEE